MPRNGLSGPVLTHLWVDNMPHRVSEPSDDVTAYLVLNDHRRFCIAFDETDPAQADRETIIRNFRSHQYENVLRAFNTAAGWSLDVSEDMEGPLLDLQGDADENLGEDTKRFIDRHVADFAHPARARTSTVDLVDSQEPDFEQRPAAPAVTALSSNEASTFFQERFA
jgi:hypothetical protein